MCGIVGIWNSFEVNKNYQLETLKNMINPLTHRGPDDIGLWNDFSKGIALAHRRLSIQDLSKSGHQPMISPSGRYVIFNGEIYNHFDLRNELSSLSKLKISWKGKSDTETLLLAIECWPIEKVLKKIIGMFAFAIWDRKNRSLILARDRFGEKPLYYGLVKSDGENKNKDFVFVSELSALKAFNDNSIDSSALSCFFKYGYIPAPLSIYSGIKSFHQDIL